jgi:uncharacterized repeat protein (TIGR04138 family)
MNDTQFDQAVNEILMRERRFDPMAYYFLKEALDYTAKRLAEAKRGKRHVTGPELMEGFRDHALEQFGPMASTLMREWGVREAKHVGEMVFQLIDQRVFGKQESDKPEDFTNAMDLESALVEPFIPRARKMRPRAGRRANRPAKS